jgi:hypothetical protein
MSQREDELVELDAADVNTPRVKIDNYVLKHASTVDLEALQRRGLRRIHTINISKINALVSHVVVRAIEKYQARLTDVTRGKIEAEIEAELRRKLGTAITPVSALPRLPRPAASPEPAAAAADPGTPSHFGESMLDELEQRVRVLVRRSVEEEFARRGDAHGNGASAEQFSRGLENLIGDVLGRQRNKPAIERDLASTQRTELLERRLAKLKKELLEMEVAMEALATTKEGDPGLSSIYREVQGLNRMDTSYEKKKGLLQGVFEANLKLQSERAP